MTIDKTLLQTIDFSWYPELTKAGHVFKDVYVSSVIPASNAGGPYLTFKQDGSATVTMDRVAIMALDEYEELLALKEAASKSKDRGYPTLPRR